MTDNNIFFPLFSELNIYHPSFFLQHVMYSTLMLLTVCRTCDIYEIEIEIALVR